MECCCLQAQQHSMKLKLLHKALVDQAVEKCPNASNLKQALKADLLKALSSSSQFRISGKTIMLSK